MPFRNSNENDVTDLIGVMLRTAASHPACRPSLVPSATCRSCGCTQYNCSRCVGRTGITCDWVHTLVNGAEYDLCTACAKLSPNSYGYADRMERARRFVSGLTVFDLFALAATASVAEYGPNAPENETEHTLVAWYAARRALAAKAGLGMTLALDDAVGLSVAIMAYPNVSQARAELVALSETPRLFQTVALGPQLAPFVFLAPARPCPRHSCSLPPLHLKWRDLTPILSQTRTRPHAGFPQPTQPQNPQPQKEIV